MSYRPCEIAATRAQEREPGEYHIKPINDIDISISITWTQLVRYTYLISVGWPPPLCDHPLCGVLVA